MPLKTIVHILLEVINRLKFIILYIEIGKFYYNIQIIHCLINYNLNLV